MSQSRPEPDDFSSAFDSVDLPPPKKKAVKARSDRGKPKKKSMRTSRKAATEIVRHRDKQYMNDPNRTDWDPVELCSKMHIFEIRQAYITILNGLKARDPNMTIQQARNYIQQNPNPIPAIEQHQAAVL